MRHDSFHIAVLAGDGIGPEVMAPALEVLPRIETKAAGLNFRFTEAPAGAAHYRETGTALPEETIKLCQAADAILLGACGLPQVRYPDGTEIAPQVELRFIFDLYAGMRPARLIPGVQSPIAGADQRGIDFVIVRESTEGLFASIGKGSVTPEEARETLVITRTTSRRLFDFALRLAERRKRRGGKGLVHWRTCSAPSPSSAKSSRNAPGIIRICARTAFTLTPAPPRSYSGRGISTCSSRKICLAIYFPI
jgi:3-isopropylmalate dehydrogenase